MTIHFNFFFFLTSIVWILFLFFFFLILKDPSASESRNSGGTANVLPEERAKASFDIEKMTNVLDGGF